MRPSGNPRLRATSWLICALLTQIATLPLTALVEPADSPIRAKSFRHDDLYIGNVYVPATELKASRAQDLATLGVGPDAAFMDVRSGRWGTLMPRQALLPGDGRGNNLEWEQLGLTAPAGDAEHRELAWNAVIGYLSQHQGVLGIDAGELASPGRVTIHNGGNLVQIHATRRVGGVPVRDSFVKAAISHGNLILLGATAGMCCSARAPGTPGRTPCLVRARAGGAPPVLSASHSVRHLGRPPARRAGERSAERGRGELVDLGLP